MNPTDPRRRKPILLGGEDAMEEDEDVDVSLPTTSLQQPTSTELISDIITPSPFAAHNAGPTSARFRNALNRVTTNPTKDTEAWQALMTEVSACYRNITNVHAMDAETHAKLDWVESCYGALLKNFPYATSYYVAIMEILWTTSARFGEEGGPVRDYETSRRATQCQAKLERLFQKAIGVNPDGTMVDEPTVGMGSWNVDLWLLYIRKAARDATRNANNLPVDERASYVREAIQKAYELGITHAGFSYNNHLLWKQYLDFVKSWVDAQNTTDHALRQQQQIQLRSVYQRLITHPMTGLDQLWQEYEAYERGQGEALAQALASEFAPKYQHARTVYLERNRVYSESELQLTRLATPPNEDTDGMQEEYYLLVVWKKRISYERTNPERLATPELLQRIRSAYKELVSVMTRHPECWNMWSTWELLEAKKPDRAIAVLQLAQTNIPDCTLLAHAQSQIVEIHQGKGAECLQVLEDFLQRSSNTLAFVLYQHLVRRYKGLEEARAVFARARRTLADPETIQEADTENAEQEEETNIGETTEVIKEEMNGPRSMVTNRLDPSVGTHKTEGEKGTKTEITNNKESEKLPPGPITWHLYASHATIEHRYNRCPEVAARVYELGLRKHSPFLTKPPYILRYAQLLLELGDTMNLKALLARATAACQAQGKDDAVTALWDMTLYFESLTTGSEPSASIALHNIERQRREALMGPEVEDVATGGFVGIGEAALIGAQKSTIAEHLVRSEGYDVSSSIVNGMSRIVDVFEVMGLWGNGESEIARLRQKIKGNVKQGDIDISGGRSDISYHKRLQYHSILAAGISTDGVGGEVSGSKQLTARERLQQAQGAGATTAGVSTAMTMVIQQMPEWLRPLLLLLPASRLRLPVVAKPPPHFVEMALSSLTKNSLPVDRPTDEPTTSSGKRKIAFADGDSSDEENGGASGGGYGNQFRARQRARIKTSENGQ